MENRRDQKRMAVLIDADNAQASIIERLLAEIAKYGVSSVKRIYGDWTTTRLKEWKKVLLDYAIQPIQQFAYTKGKNATDSALIIDAMDLLYTESLDGFCIVSSDSDFTRLAVRIRENGLMVLGFGEKKTPQPFVASCDKFIWTEILREDTTTEQTPVNYVSELRRNTRLVALLRSAVEDSADDSGWAYLGSIGQNIVSKMSQFDSRNYGFKKLGELMEASNLFLKEERTLNNAPGKLVYFKDNRKKK